MIRRFINRSEELEILEREWKKENAFVIVYGRRRVGKTRLIEEFLKTREGVFYTAEDVSKSIQIAEFKNAVANYLGDEFLKNQEIREWGHLFSYLERTVDRNKKFYIWMDEFTYIVKNSPEITSVLQKFIDRFLRKSRIFFIVSGSLFGIMNEKVLSSASPLYGRRTRDILLVPLSFGASRQFVNYSLEDGMKLYFTVGGIPEYLLVAENYGSYEEFVTNEFFRKDGYFYREPYFILSREFREIKTYFSILAAIAFGNTNPTTIANFVGIRTREIYPYLENLMTYGFVSKMESLSRKKSVYVIKDVFFDFWFNFVYRYRESIETGRFFPGKTELNEYFGKRFEIFVMENIVDFFPGLTTVKKDFGTVPGSSESYEIDIVSLNEQTKEILFAECKWQPRVNAEKVCRELAEKTEYVDWHKNERKERFAVFARSFSKRISEFEGRPVHCFDLKDLGKLTGTRS